MTNNQTKPAHKEPVLKDIDDVISIGALLRPTFFQAISSLKTAQKEEFLKTLIEVEKTLSQSSVPLRIRFQNVDTLFQRTFSYAPIWRFIATRLQETWSEVQSPTVKELSIVSLLVGMMTEETQNQLDSKKSKTRQTA